LCYKDNQIANSKEAKMFSCVKMPVRVGLVVLTALAMLFAISYAPSQVLAATAPSLGAAESFAVLGASAVTNTGPSVIIGDLGIWPNNASSVTGFPPGSYSGALHAADAVALQAQSDVTAAYIALAGQPVTQDLTGTDLGGLTLNPGVYHFSSSAQLTGTLTLDAQNNANSVFIFQIGSTLTTATDSSVVVINAPPNFCNKYWQVGSSATLGVHTAFQGNILALTSITLNTGASLSGRALARNGAVTMDDNLISPPLCGGTTPPTGTLEIFKFNDLNGNGVYNPTAETPLANWHYHITGPGGYNSSGNTDGSGLIVKTGLAPGNYTVTETVQAGWTVTTANPQTGIVPAIGGKRFNFGNTQAPSVQPGTLEIFKFNDLNGNGVFDPPTETFLAGWDYSITGPGGYSNSGTTDASGFIVITGLAPGDYTVTETVQPGWTVTTANPQTGTVPAEGGKRLNFGNIETETPLVQPGNLEIFKFNDLNGNGVYDPTAETPLANWHYTITGPGGYSSFGVTDESGLIVLLDLGLGDYTVTETVQPGWTVTTANPQIGTLSEGAGKRLNFGNRQPGVLQIFKFNDLNGNGVWDRPKETPLADWHFHITGPGGYSSSGNTDSLGLLIITGVGGLVPGNYTVREMERGDWVPTTANPQTVTVPAGGIKELRFGNQHPVVVPVGVPASSNLSTGLMVGGFATLIILFVLWRTRRSQHQRR
jgi:hypothetical protein